MAFGGSLELDDDERAIARALGRWVEELERNRNPRGGTAPVARFRLSELRRRLVKERVFGDPSRLLQRLKRRGLVEDVPEGGGEHLYHLPAPGALREILRVETDVVEATEPIGLQPVLNENAEIRAMDSAFLDALRDVLLERWEETVEFGKNFSADLLAGYLRRQFGDALYLDALIAILQQYALADVPLVAPTGRTTGATGFHLALFGPPGTGKTFSIDDLIRGNPRTGVPPHGLPGRNRYCGGITPAQFLRVGANYQGRTFNFIVPEFNDWFKYRGMVEPLKLVMEQREVKWETTLGTVGPYTFHSFFSVNYNVRTGGLDDYWTTVSDPNFSALEDRMLLRFHQMTRERFRAVEASAERLELGELTFDLAAKVRDHLTLVHAVETRHPLVAGRFPAKPVRLERRLYEKLREVSENALERAPRPKFSPRLKSRAVRLAAAAALVGYFQHEDETSLPVRGAEATLGEQFYREEIYAREGRKGSTG